VRSHAERLRLNGGIANRPKIPVAL
jgi:hypothetical protein